MEKSIKKSRRLVVGSGSNQYQLSEHDDGKEPKDDARAGVEHVSIIACIDVGHDPTESSPTTYLEKRDDK